MHFLYDRGNEMKIKKKNQSVPSNHHRDVKTTSHHATPRDVKKKKKNRSYSTHMNTTTLRYLIKFW